MNQYRLPAAALALVAAIGCGGGGSGPSNAAPVAKFSIQCTQLSCTFTDASTDSDGSVASWDWAFGDGSPNVTTKNSAHTYTAAGPYHVKLTVTDNDGASSATADSLVTVSGAPGNTNPTANFTFTCTGLDCTFTDGSSDPDAGDAIAAWDWDFGDGTAHATVQNPMHTYSTVTSPATEQVTLLVTDTHAGTGTVTKGVAVTPPGGLTCDNGSGTFVGCALTLTSKSTVTITLTTASCNAVGDGLAITSPIMQTIFTDGCHETQGTVFQVNGGTAFAANTDLQAQVTSGSTVPPADRIPPQVHVSGAFPHWTLNFDDGEGCPGDVTCGGTEPDFNDLVLDVNATVVP